MKSSFFWADIKLREQPVKYLRKCDLCVLLFVCYVDLKQSFKQLLYIPAIFVIYTFLQYLLHFLQVLIDLTTACLTDEPYWYQLSNHDNTTIPLPSSSPRTVCIRKTLRGLVVERNLIDCITPIGKPTEKDNVDCFQWGEWLQTGPSKQCRPRSECRSSLISVYVVYHSICVFQMHYCR